MSDEKVDGFDAWHDAKYPEPDEDAPYHWKVQWRGAKSERQQVWEAALSAHGLPVVDESAQPAEAVGPTCQCCGANVLYECPACSSSNYQKPAEVVEGDAKGVIWQGYDAMERMLPNDAAQGAVDDTVHIGANVAFGDDWFTQLFVEGVMFLVPVENKDRGRHILAAKKRHPHPAPDTTAAKLLGLVDRLTAGVCSEDALIIGRELRTIAGKIKEGGT